MNAQKLHRIMAQVQDICAFSGVRLTKKRERILELLLMSDIPLSAYEVAKAYNRASKSPMPTMSVYRILDFLESEQLVHKLNSANKYIACSHISCSHSHEVSQFLICGVCENVKEITIAKSLVKALGKQVTNAGYKLINSQIEIQCVCENCTGSEA